MDAFLFKNTANYLWHAFTTLDTDKSGTVSKSKLKVLTSNLASIMGSYGLEQGLDHYKSTPRLNFENYQYYLREEVFSVVANKLSSTNIRNYEAKIGKLCWLVCCRRYLTKEGVTLSEDCLFKLFVIFCMSSELKPKSNGSHEVTLHPSEAIHISQTLANSLGCLWDEDEFAEVVISIGPFQFEPFISILESRCFSKIQVKEAVEEAITDMYETYVEDVVKKGYLSKKVNPSLPIMREYWFVLKFSTLVYFKSKNDKAICGCVDLEKDIEIEPKSGNSFSIINGKRKVLLQAKDPITRLQWISALRTAVGNWDSKNYNRVHIRKARMERQKKFDEQICIQNEVSELEQLKRNLERLLEEAMEAKRNEEIVRSLQARVLAEEWEKREELERLQKEQKEQLEEEVSKRIEYEELQQKNELQLKAAEEMLHQLEEQKLNVDSKLQNALDKIHKIEQHKQFLERKLIQVGSFLEEGPKVRRAHSFMPTTRGNRPTMLEVRAAAMLLMKP